MEPDELEKIVSNAVTKVLNDRRTVPESVHLRDHEYVKLLIEEKRKKAEMYQQVKMHIFKYGAIGLMSGLGILTWHYIVSVIQHIPTLPPGH